MFLKTALALAGLLSLAVADTLPGTLIIYVYNSTGANIGSLTGYGNFSSPGPSYPFRTTQTSGGYATLRGFYGCSASAGGILSCSDSAGAASSFDASSIAIPAFWLLKLIHQTSQSMETWYSRVPTELGRFQIRLMLVLATTSLAASLDFQSTLETLQLFPSPFLSMRQRDKWIALYSGKNTQHSEFLQFSLES